MTEETLTPIFHTETPAKPIGRRADLLASVIAGIATTLSIIGAMWFFLGFAENDTRLEHLTSALVLTLGLFAFAIIPFAFVMRFTWRSYRYEVKSIYLFWTLFLMLPWLVLGVITVSHTPLPMWCGFLVTGFAGLLSLWAIVSLVLERRPKNTLISQQNEMHDASN